MNRHILSLHAHPDDAETLAGGTLALLAEKGHRVTIATMTAGDCGAIETDAIETSRIRKREATAAASLIGAAFRCAEIPDLGVFSDDRTRRTVVELIRSIGPDIVLTSSPVDYHPDHEATALLARDACFAVSAPNYQTGMAPVMAAIPHLYFMDPIEGCDRDGNVVQPQFAVNVDAMMDTKRRMLAAHASQQSWVRKQHGIDSYVGAMEAWTRHRGRTFGVAHAEGFRQYTSHPYPRTALLQELVAEALLGSLP